MAQAMYPHICEMCAISFSSRKRAQRTCGWSCRAKLATTSPTKMICDCGKPARSRRGYCADCAIERKRQTRRDFHDRHREDLKETRRIKYAANANIRAAIYATSQRARFNGLRIDRLKLDKYTCQQCGSREKLVVHHHEKVADRNRKDQASGIDDLLTLCRCCHMNHHRELGDLKGKAA